MYFHFFIIEGVFRIFFGGIHQQIISAITKLPPLSINGLVPNKSLLINQTLNIKKRASFDNTCILNLIEATDDKSYSGNIEYEIHETGSKIISAIYNQRIALEKQQIIVKAILKSSI